MHIFSSSSALFNFCFMFFKLLSIFFFYSSVLLSTEFSSFSISVILSCFELFYASLSSSCKRNSFNSFSKFAIFIPLLFDYLISPCIWSLVYFSYLPITFSLIYFCSSCSSNSCIYDSSCSFNTEVLS